jgi:hypothetical protein
MLESCQYLFVSLEAGLRPPVVGHRTATVINDSTHRTAIASLHRPESAILIRKTLHIWLVPTPSATVFSAASSNSPPVRLLLPLSLNDHPILLPSSFTPALN